MMPHAKRCMCQACVNKRVRVGFWVAVMGCLPTHRLVATGPQDTFLGLDSIISEMGEHTGEQGSEK